MLSASPDIAVYRETPAEEIPTRPALLVIEIVSSDDRHQQLLPKLQDYSVWGVPNIWVVEPILKKFHVYRSGNLEEVSRFELAGLELSVDATGLFAEVIVP